MSLAINAAPFNYDESNESEYINIKKRSSHNKTQKKNIKENFESERFDKNKVNNVLETIHNKMSETEDDNELGDFNPPPKPESVGVMKTVATEQMQNMMNSKNLNNNNPKLVGVGLPPASYDTGDLELNNYMNNYGNVKTAEEYYRKMLPPQFQKQTKPQYNPYYNNNNNSFPENSSNDVLLKKINYMINLLEEQKDERTNNVTEEVVLYSFLGIFVIFVVDSFAKVGKYVR